MQVLTSSSRTRPESDVGADLPRQGRRTGAIYISNSAARQRARRVEVWRWTPAHGLEVWPTGLTVGDRLRLRPGRPVLRGRVLDRKNLIKAAPGNGRGSSGSRRTSTSPTTIVSGLDLPGGFAAGNGAILHIQLEHPAGLHRRRADRRSAQDHSVTSPRATARVNQRRAPRRASRPAGVSAPETRFAPARGAGRAVVAQADGVGRAQLAPGGASVRPWRRITSPIAAISGGPPDDAATTSPTSRK